MSRSYYDGESFSLGQRPSWNRRRPEKSRRFSEAFGSSDERWYPEHGRRNSAKLSANRQKRDVEPANLFLQELGRAVVPENKIGPFYFLRQWQLLGNSLLGERAR